MNECKNIQVLLNEKREYILRIAIDDIEKQFKLDTCKHSLHIYEFTLWLYK